MKDVAIEVSVRVTDGSFESSMRVPVNATKEQHQQLGEMWIKALHQAIAITQTHSEEK